MWLLPFFSLVSNLAARIFYRMRVAGPAPPKRGPLLLVANHPNALLDPALVIAAARRPVRFLAKAPLFNDRMVGWVVRGVGSIPVYRRIDDPEQMERNREMFQVGFHALASGAAIGLFPEGTSHSDPAIKPLKTGAARLALGASRRIGSAFPIVPLGLVFRNKERFRSTALVVLGPPIEWHDLVVRSPGPDSDRDDRHAVIELTQRIDDALRAVTVNLERWQDEPLLHCAEAIWQAEKAPSSTTDPAEQVQRIGVASRLLARWREQPSDQDPLLPQALLRHAHRLERLGMTPTQLRSDAGLRTSARWTASRLYLLGIPALALAISGYLLYYVPFHLTGRFTAMANPEKDQIATYKVLIGALVYGLWLLLLSVAAGWIAVDRLGWTSAVLAAVLTFLVLPWIGMAGLWIREHWRGTARDLRQFFFLRSRSRLVARLRDQQRELSARIAAAVATADDDQPLNQENR